MTGTATFRPPTTNDVDLFMRLQRACFPWAVEASADRAAMGLFTSIQNGSAGRLASFAVAELDRQFAGYAAARPFAPWVGGQEVVSPDTPVAVVTQVAVPPKFRRRGIGARLLSELEEQLVSLEYSLAVAHIQADLAPWYNSLGWTALPPGAGLAWIEPPSSINQRLLPPGAPAEVLATHTPLLHDTPLNAHGYTTLAFKITRAPMRVIAAGYYAATDNAARNARAAAVALITSLDADPAALAQVPHASAVILKASTMEPAATAEWLSNLGRGSSDR